MAEYAEHSMKKGRAKRVTKETSDVANLMELLKVARRKLGSFNPDDYVDGAGYSGVSYECRLAELKHETKSKKT